MPLLRKYGEVLRTLCAAADVCVAAGAWAAAYALRFHTDLLPPAPGGTDPRDYVIAGILIVPLVYAGIRYRGLYAPRRGLSRWAETRALLEITSVVTLLLAASTFFWRERELSRLTVLLFWGLASGGLITFRMLLRIGLGEARRRGYNVRRVLIVGTGEASREVYLRLHDRPETGFSVIGFLGPSRAGLGDGGVPPNLGPYEQLHGIVTEHTVDQVFIALDRSDPMDPIKLVNELQDTLAAVRIVPDLLGLRKLRACVEDFDGLPMICLVESPVLGWNEVAKRACDIALSSIGLIVLSPILAAVAVAVRTTSAGPILYRQERMSLDGRHFMMLKFRTMVPNAEAATGPRWAVKDDPRRTRLGSLLRRTNLDEFPQLWNVFRGDMSIVGPRPERPEFIESFRHELPGYMLRHKVKGGLTGWAQVNGLRGNTSISERLDHDLEYAQRWSLGFDLKIIALTMIRSFRDPNAY